MIINNLTERKVSMETDQTELRLEDDDKDENGDNGDDKKEEGGDDAANSTNSD